MRLQHSQLLDLRPAAPALIRPDNQITVATPAHEAWDRRRLSRRDFAKWAAATGLAALALPGAAGAAIPILIAYAKGIMAFVGAVRADVAADRIIKALDAGKDPKDALPRDALVARRVIGAIQQALEKKEVNHDRGTYHKKFDQAFVLDLTIGPEDTKDDFSFDINKGIVRYAEKADALDSDHALNVPEMYQITKKDEQKRFQGKVLYPISARTNYDEDDDGDNFRKCVRQYHADTPIALFALYIRTFSEGNKEYRAFGVTDRTRTTGGLIICGA